MLMVCEGKADEMRDVWSVLPTKASRLDRVRKNSGYRRGVKNVCTISRSQPRGLTTKSSGLTSRAQTAVVGSHLVNTATDGVVQAFNECIHR